MMFFDCFYSGSFIPVGGLLTIVFVSLKISFSYRYKTGVGFWRRSTGFHSIEYKRIILLVCLWIDVPAHIERESYIIDRSDCFNQKNITQIANIPSSDTSTLIFGDIIH